jgi:hypothetical protein
LPSQLGQRRGVALSQFKRQVPESECSRIWASPGFGIERSLSPNGSFACFLSTTRQRWTLEAIRLLCRRTESYEGLAEQADAQNPAMTIQFQTGSEWRGVCDPLRSATNIVRHDP